MSDEQSKKISDILSDKDVEKQNSYLEMQVRPDGAAPMKQGSSGMGMFSHGLFANSHFHGPVSFHFSNTSVSESQTHSQMSSVNYHKCTSTSQVHDATVSPLIRPKYKRIRTIESDDSD